MELDIHESIIQKVQHGACELGKKNYFSQHFMELVDW